MKSRIVGALAAALTSLGVFAGTAGAISGTGVYNSGNSTNSFQSPPRGTCHAANTLAGNYSNGIAIYLWTDFCGPTP